MPPEWLDQSLDLKKTSQILRRDKCRRLAAQTSGVQDETHKTKPTNKTRTGKTILHKINKPTSSSDKNMT